jgi:hypothetical protein
MRFSWLLHQTASKAGKAVIVETVDADGPGIREVKGQADEDAYGCMKEQSALTNEKVVEDAVRHPPPVPEVSVYDFAVRNERLDETDYVFVDLNHGDA